MTTATALTHHTGHAANPGRVLSVARLHFVNVRTTIVIPLSVLGVIFAANLAIWGIIIASVSPADRADVRDGMAYSGSTGYLFVYMIVVAVQAMNATFPFALGFGATRRDFYLGTCLAYFGLSVGYGALMTVMELLERATSGWGLGGHMFTAVYFGDGPWYEHFVIFTSALLFFFGIGLAFGTVFVRWRTAGLLIFMGAILFVLLGIAALVSFVGSWTAVGEWFAANGSFGVTAWSLVPTVVAAIAGYFILLRATPKN